jgi:hypothetical protein
MLKKRKIMSRKIITEENNAGKGGEYGETGDTIRRCMRKITCLTSPQHLCWLESHWCYDTNIEIFIGICKVN